VLDNLHILDSDYYFRIIDKVLEGNGSSLFLILDNVLRLGFDGHHFLLGLGEHIRNLILAGDPNTLSLLEQSPESIEKLKIQSSRAAHTYYLNLLSLANQAELQYRSSKNPRLLTELCLMKMANVMAVMRSQQSEKKKPDRVENFRSPEPSIKEVTAVPKLSFKKTPSLNAGMPSAEKGEIASEPDQVNLKKESLRLETARERYLKWFSEKQLGPVSAWTLALKEEKIENGFRLIFKSGSISEDAFRDELKTIQSYFLEHFDKSPQFEILSSNEAQGTLAPYTNQEKFIFMAKNSHKLTLLKQTLGLDFSN
jgi:DNA polymerase-3 subunit gamma/tau